NQKKSIKGFKVTQTVCREIATLAGINPASKLSFTAEDTVSNFTRESDRKKLETLLEAVGKQDYYSKLGDLELELREIEKEIDPLEKTLLLKQANLESMKKALETLKEQSRLARRFEFLKLELAWSRVGQIEGVREELETSKNQKIAYLLSIEKQKDENSQKIVGLTLTRDNLKQSIQNLNNDLSKTIGEKTAIEHHVATLIKEKHNSENKILTIENKLKQTSGRGVKDFENERKQITREIHDLENQITKLKEERKNLEKQLEETKQKQLQTFEKKDTPIGMTSWEKTLLKDAVLFKKSISKTRIQGISGPVIENIKLTGDKSWEPAVKRLLGRYLFAFVATSREAYHLAKLEYDNLFGKARSPIIVARYDTDMGKQRDSKTISDKFVGYADDMVKGPKEIKAFLRDVINSVLAEDSKDPNLLTDLARKHRLAVLTKNGLDYFERFGGFTRPPPPVTSRIGKSLSEDTRKEFDTKEVLLSLQENLSTIMKEIVDTTSKKSELLKQSNDLNNTIRDSFSDDTIRRERDEIKNQVNELITEIDDQKSIMDHLKENIERISETRAEEDQAFNNLENSVFQAEMSNANIDGQIKQLQKDLEGLEHSVDVLQNELGELIMKAEHIGSRPDQIRLTKVVEEEKAKVKGYLDAIVGAQVNEDDITKSQKEVNELKNYLNERTNHMDGLKDDIKTRLDQWESDISQLISFLSETMTKLLGQTGIGEIKIIVRKQNDPKNAELKISVHGEGRPQRSFSSLSGGEKVMLTTALVMALHLRSDSAIHGLDEFSQRLDPRNTDLAFKILHETAKHALDLNDDVIPQYLIFLPGIQSHIELNPELTEIFYIGRVAHEL
ncbi:MAG: hypothetical protein ACXAB2_10940, partial [Candidatus Hodarchaeales archaeon]